MRKLLEVDEPDFNDRIAWEEARDRLKRCLPKEGSYVTDCFVNVAIIAIHMAEEYISQASFEAIAVCCNSFTSPIEVRWRYEQGPWQGWVAFISGDMYIEKGGFPVDVDRLRRSVGSEFK